MYKSAILAVMTALGVLGTASAAEVPAATHFHAQIEPVLTQYCYDCHGNGAKKGGVILDEFDSNKALLSNRDLWFKVLKNVRAGLMPPAGEARPSADEVERLGSWIKFDAFGIDPKNPDPGRVTVRRLNRTEYRNTIRDLLGVDYDTAKLFPPDDAGYGFDNISDVLTLSPMLLDKYVDAAHSIVASAVPVISAVPAEKIIPGRAFLAGSTETKPAMSGSLSLSYYKEASVSNSFAAEHPGRYQLLLDLDATENYVDNVFDYNHCRLVFKVDGQKMLEQEFSREGGKPFHYEFTETNWLAGRHDFGFELEPLTPDQKQIRSLAIRINSLTVRGPLEEKFLVPPRNYERFFPKPIPKKTADRRAYARELLGRFATRAFRRPVNAAMVNRLAVLAEEDYRRPGESFESGVAHAMEAVLVSPQFLYREEGVEAPRSHQAEPWVDDALASRLSYFLWSSMPDDELIRLAGEKKLRANLSAQVARMLADPRAAALVQNFTGQWLQGRDIEVIPMDARAVLAREEKPNPSLDQARARAAELGAKPEDGLTDAEKQELASARRTLSGGGRGGGFFRRPRGELTDDLRRTMRQEAEMYFANVVHEDRSVLELIDSDYTYLNEPLAKHYGLTNLAVNGNELRRVTLPPDSPRGGVLTMGTVLACTSNPTRTSPVKRGLFILENVLGTPVPPPPPNIPALEDSEKAMADRVPTLREVLAVHRGNPLCSSCHNRMDPLGLALENFNAMGMWRDQEHGQSIESAGKLITGEPFQNVRELKHILATTHHREFYRTLTEKMLTYALGRGLEYYDVQTVDNIVDRLEAEGGRMSVLLNGVIDSAPFQKTRDSG